MRFLVQLALAAAALFAVSAALSVWLYQTSHPAADAADTGKAKKKDAERPEKEREKEPEPKKLPDPVPTPPGADPGGLAALREREARAERRQAQVELVLRDLLAEREAYDALLRQANGELKQAAARTAEVAAAPPPVDAAKAKADAEAAEQKNVAAAAQRFDAMAPEAAAPILRQMADSGKMDLAVRILAQMKDRQAARVLGEFGDNTLAAQLFSRMVQLRPNGTVAPAAGTPANLPPLRPPLPTP
jgi:flagellar motility protein MotE (MotC chaperone)